MAKKMDHRQAALDIVRLVGGPENVQALGHCMTRLRFVLKDEGKADGEAIKKIGGVLGVVSSGGQFMVILGQNLLPVFEAAQKEFHFTAGDAGSETKEKQPLTLKSAGSAVLGYVSASVAPMITGLVAGGMLKVVLLLLTTAFPSFDGTQSYLLLSAVADAAFFFMPIFVAYGAATKLGGTPIYSMISAAALLHGNYTAMVAAGEAVHLLGIPVRLVSYSSSLLPALLIALLAYWVEKGLNKIVPGIFKSLLVGLGTIFVTMIFGYTVLGPLGSFIGTYISMIFVFLGGHVGFIAMGALAACLPWLVMCGMHTALVPFMTQAISDPGYDPVFRPAFILHNMAEGGACIGVGLRTKNTELRAEAFSIGFGCIVAGVTEPAVYGINLRLRKPMFGVMAGGAVGGIVAGLMGARAYVMGYSTVLALPIFQDTMLAMAVGIVIAILVAAAVTFVLGFEDDIPAEDPAPAIESSSTETGTAEPVVYAPVAGTVVAREDIPDETFAAGILGDGVGIEPEKGEVVAPFDGVISSTTDTFHAVGISGPADMELLIHVGVNTVEMKGEGFTLHVKEGDRVKKGQKLITFDIAKIKAAGHPATTAVLVTNREDYDAFTIEAVQKVAAGAKLITVK